MGRQTGVGANRIRVQVLGTPTILGVPDGQHVRPQAMEFLVYLIVRGGSAYQHDILGDLIPEPPHRLATQRLHTYTYNLRQTFRSISGDNTYLRLRRHHYTLNTDAFDIDLWTMRDAITAAQHATSTEATTAALRHAVAAYRGPLAADTGYPWLARHQQAVSREFLTAAVNLAEALAHRPAEAHAVLDTAAHHHPDDELLAAAATIRDRLG
ncbi:AfsR/SARP family transcriptional regulator [Micromonospora parastrephiae]|uniref:AfsR/SARP family transcriptional regulator n=1 Tax=Micromonospora parastrephiae TaxID=2806101 RepID=UPI001EE463B8|nr:BTAD domain-containing putative transcriptional regulator [Micromonospora parastrephiae]